MGFSDMISSQLLTSIGLWLFLFSFKSSGLMAVLHCSPVSYKEARSKR